MASGQRRQPAQQPVVAAGTGSAGDVRITHIDIYKLNVPLSKPFVISLGTITEARNIVVRLHTDAGSTGVGECCPYVYIVGETQASCFAHARMLAALWIGKNPLQIEDRLAELNRAMAFNSTVKSAFDLALYDLLGKHCGAPLHVLLGGKTQRPIYTDMTVGIDTPSAMAAAARKFQKDGFPVLKVKLGGAPQADIDRMQAIRQAVGENLPIRIDANQGWDYLSALQVLQAIAPLGIEHCEEPLPRWNLRDLARVRERSPIPIMADESLFDHHDALSLVAAGACDLFNVKLSKSGGINGVLKILAIAEAAGIRSQAGGMSETRFATTALAHIAAARSNLVFFDLDSPLMLLDDPVTGGLRYEPDWQVTLPDAPGIGADFDPAYLDRMESVTIE